MAQIVPNPGMAQRANAALQIPLHAKYHVGEFGIDHGQGMFKTVEEWERQYGTQVEMLNLVSEWLGYSVWDLYSKWKD